MKKKLTTTIFALLLCPLLIVCMIPASSAGGQYYDWAADGGFEAWGTPSGAPATIGPGVNSIAASWTTASSYVWDVYLFTAAQYTAWSADRDNTTLSAVEKHLNTQNGSFFRMDLDPTITYKFTAYVRVLSNMRDLDVLLIWDYVESGDIPGFEIFFGLLALVGLLAIYLQKKTKFL